MVNFAQFGSVKKGIEESIKPQFNNRALIGPEPFKRFRIIKSETNGGTAIVITKIVRQNALYFKPFVLISKAKMIPKETSCGCENSPNQGPAKYWKER